MSRIKLGVVSLLLLALGVYLAFRGDSSSTLGGLSGACIKVGLVLGALWLALPQIMAFLAKTPAWLVTASVIGLIVGVVHPVYLLFVVPVLGVMWFFAPRLASKADKPIVPQKRPRRRSQA